MTAYGKAVEADSPLRYWPMEDASGELAPVGSGAKIKLTNGPTYRQTGAVKGGLGAVSFDGTNDFGQVALPLGGLSLITVEFWLWWDTNGTDDDFAMEQGPTANASPGFNFDWNNSTGGGAPPGGETDQVSIKTNWAVPASGSHRHSFQRPSAKAWHHVVAVITAKGGVAPIIYIDGVAVTVTQRENPNPGNEGFFTDDTLNLFCRNGAALFGKGKMEQIAVYSGALSKARVEAHFAAASEEEGGSTARALPIIS